MSHYSSIFDPQKNLGGDNRCLILKPSLTTTTKLFPFLLQHSETKMKKKTIFPFSSCGKTRSAIFYIVSRYFAEISPISRKYRDIFGGQKYRDIFGGQKYHNFFSAIFRLAENIAIFSGAKNIAIFSQRYFRLAENTAIFPIFGDISPILSSLVLNIYH